MIGPPGSGKTMLAKRIPTILPPFTFEEAMETTKIHSVAGSSIGNRVGRNPPLSLTSPYDFRCGVDWRRRVPRPGEVSLLTMVCSFWTSSPNSRETCWKFCASRSRMGRQHCPGVHFADLSRPVHVGRRNESLSVRIPQRPQSRMPVHTADDPALHFENFRSPLDRIDIHIDVPAVNYKEMRSTNEPESSAKIRDRVINARQKQLERFATSRQKLYCNAQMSSRHIRCLLRTVRRL